MKKINSLINVILAFSSGFTASSIWIHDSESWKISLPIFLLALSFKQFIND